MLESFINTLKQFTGDALFNVLAGLIALVLGFFVVKFFKFLTKKILNRLPIGTTITSFLQSIIFVVIYIIYIMIVLGSFGIPVDGIFTLVASVGVAVGLALKDSLSNIANGILLVVMKPFKVGDYVNINGVEGTVIQIHLISVKKRKVALLFDKFPVYFTQFLRIPTFLSCTYYTKNFQFTCGVPRPAESYIDVHVVGSGCLSVFFFHSGIAFFAALSIKIEYKNSDGNKCSVAVFIRPKLFL